MQPDKIIKRSIESMDGRMKAIENFLHLYETCSLPQTPEDLTLLGDEEGSKLYRSIASNQLAMMEALRKLSIPSELGPEEQKLLELLLTLPKDQMEKLEAFISGLVGKDGEPKQMN